MGVPGQRGRQRLGLKIVGERGEVSPCGVAAQQLDRARKKHEAEQRPAQQPYARLRGYAQKKRKEARFEQKQVPLKAHKLLTGVKERKIKRIEKKQTQTRQDVENKEQRQRRSGPA